MNTQFELAIIGGGTAAITAAMRALECGAKSIAIIEGRRTLGGECALNACVPSKTLLTAVKLWNVLHEKSADYGLEIAPKKINFQHLMEKVDEVIAEGDNPFEHDSRVTVINDYACFMDPDTLLLQQSQEHLKAERYLIATGSSARKLTIPGAEEVGYMTFQQASHLKELPKSMAILGAGPVGVEFCYIFASLGVQVTLLHKDATLLPHEEPEVQTAVMELLHKLGVHIVTDANLVKLTQGETGNRKCVHFKTQSGTAQSLEIEEILSAVGMHPNIERLGLEVADIQANPEKGIVVTPDMQTTNPKVWAIGDVVGHFGFTHIADYQAEIAAENALSHAHKHVDYTGIAWALYTDPAISHVGLTEAEAREQYAEVDTILCSTAEVSRYRIESELDGFIKLVIDRQTHDILGGHIFASEAEELAHVLSLAIRQRMTCELLLNSMFYIYPCRMQLIQKALERYLAPCHQPGTLESRLIGAR